MYTLIILLSKLLWKFSHHKFSFYQVIPGWIIMQFWIYSMTNDQEIGAIISIDIISFSNWNSNKSNYISQMFYHYLSSIEILSFDLQIKLNWSMLMRVAKNYHDRLVQMYNEIIPDIIHKFRQTQQMYTTQLYQYIQSIIQIELTK